MSESAISVRNLSRSFGSVRAVDNVSFEIPRGTVFGFLGPNGAGKTTMMHLLLGLLEPDSGSATVLGFDSRQQPTEIRQRSGALLEHNGLYERLSAFDNLDFYGKVWHMPASARSRRARELLEHMGLWERRNEGVAKWSRGMKQKLAVARTLMHSPQVIFLDEPTAGLDPLAAAGLREDLQNVVRQQGATVFLNTHNLTEAESLCQLIGVIREGKLIALDRPDNLRTHAGARRAEFVGSGFSDDMLAALRLRDEVASVEQQNGRLTVALHGEAPLAPVVRQLVLAGAELEEVRQGTASLEEAFLALMEDEQ